MANVKITDLLAYTDAASTDVLPIVDVSNNVTKKISISTLLKATPLGSAAAPAIAIDGDPNTGIYSPGADTLAFVEGGTEAMRIDSSGRVGIGTSSPGSLLDIRFPTSPVNNNGDGFNTLRVWTSSALAADTGGAISLGGVSATAGAASSFGQIAGRKVNATSADYAGYLQFLVNNSGGTMSEAMRINSAGRVGIGTSTPEQILTIVNNSTSVATGSTLSVVGGTANTAGEGGSIAFSNFVKTGAASAARIRSGLVNAASQETGYLTFDTNNGSGLVERMRIANGGEIYFPSVGTTASAANAFLNNASSPANQLLRSTSSRRYKTDIEDLQDQNADAILGLRPVWYRSLAEADRKDWSWYGLIAEEVAEVEPRLVFWTYLEDAYEEVDDKRQLKADAEMVPDGVQYDRLTVLLLDLVQRQNERIETLEAKVAALEAA